MWFEEGYCNENYISYSYIYNEKVISNVSINKFTIIQDGKIRKVIQLGTVMTDINYRNKGLIRRLMNEVFKDYEDKIDYIYIYLLINLFWTFILSLGLIEKMKLNIK